MLLATAIAECVTQVFRFLNTEAGQKTALVWLDNGEKARQDFERLGKWFEDLFGGNLLKP
jgi:hypothetical protein